MAVTGLAERGSIVQRDMRKSVAKFRPEKARTLSTFEEGTRSETARLSGLQIGFWIDHAHGQSWYSPTTGDTSFKSSTRQETGAMYAGVVFRNMNIRLEEHILKDMERGFIPDSYMSERRRRISTHMMKKNWAAIGDGRGGIAVAASAAVATLTCTNDNNGRGRSKGTFRLKVSTSGDPLFYEAINTATHAVVAKFFVTSKPSGTQAVVDFTGGSGNIAALNVAGLLIVEAGSYNKELIGIAGHISNADRVYQGANTADFPFLKNPEVDAADAAITPTMVNSAKQLAMSRANDQDAKNRLVCHLTFGNYFTLAAYGYASRTYNAENGKANKTFGLPFIYEDEDTTFVPDEDYEDGYMDFREKKPYFEYVQKEFGLKKTDGIGRHQWIGANQMGSTEAFENYNESVNLVWDGKGKDGMDSDEGGSPNSAVTIKNITIPTYNQVANGV